MTYYIKKNIFNLDFEIRNNERNTSIDLKKDLSPSETDKPINTEFPNVDNKKVEEDDKCHTLQLQASFFS